MNTLPAADTALVAELRQLIDAARQRAATAVNAELTQLYWRIGERIHREILGSQRAGYGEEIVATLGRQLSADYGRGFSTKSLRHMVRFAEAFPEAAIVSTLSRQLAWSHFLELIYLKEPLARDFYTHWSRAVIDFASFQPRLINPARSRFNGCWLQRRLSRKQTGSSSLHAHQLALSQGYSLNHLGAGGIAVMHRTTVTAPVPSGQAQLGANQAARWTGSGRARPLADFKQIAAIPGRFVPQLAGQLAQAHIADGARQRVVSHHPFHVVWLEADRLVVADQRPTQLVQGVLARISDTGMEASDPFLLCLASVGAFGFPAQATLGGFQFPRFAVERLRIARLPAVRRDDNILNAVVNSDGVGLSRQWRNFDLTAEGDEVAPAGIAADRRHLRDTRHLTRPAQFERAQLGQLQPLRLGVKRPANLALIQLVAHRLRAVFLLELRITRPLGVEVGKGPILIPQDLGDDRAVSVFEPDIGRIGFQFGDRPAAIDARYRPTQCPIAEASRIQGSIPSKACNTKINGQLLALFGVRIEAEFVGNRANHMESIADYPTRSANGRRDKRVNSRWTGHSGCNRHALLSRRAIPNPYAIPSSTSGVFVYP
jgi:hypothetical protein